MAGSTPRDGRDAWVLHGARRPCGAWLLQRAAPGLHVPVLGLRVPAHGAPTRDELPRQAVEEHVLLHRRVAAIGPSYTAPERLESLPPGAGPRPGPGLGQRASPGRETALQPSPVPGQGLEEVQQRDRESPPEPARPRGRTLGREQVVQPRLESAGHAVCPPVRQANSGKHESPREKETQDDQTGQGEVKLHGPWQERHAPPPGSYMG